MPSTWDPAQYERFQAERSKPFFDLMALVQGRLGMRVVDLGCGTGELTRTLHERLGARETLGLDNSETMLAKSGAFAGNSLHFVQGEIDAFAAAPSHRGAFDLIFSNAALQWVHGHTELLTHLTEALAEHGQLAVQVPANFDHPSHVVAIEVAAEEPFRAALASHRIARDRPVLAPEAYAQILDRLGYREQHVRLQVYSHHLRDWSEVVEWVKGTLLTEYRQRLPEDLYDLFLDRYRTRLGERLDHSSPYFYPFKRILVWGRR